MVLRVYETDIYTFQGLVTLFSRITKLGWFDSEKEEFVFRAVITDVTKFLQVEISNHAMTVLIWSLEKHISFYILCHYQGSPAHCMVGVHLLSQLTCEMNQVLLDPMRIIKRKTNSFSYQISEADASRSLTKHRKIASSFRDSQVRCLILNRN